jgi:malate dehydrogenase (oxaloacetate-decarboxylating)
MEGKAVLFKEFAGVDAFPICLNTKDPDEIVRIVQMLEPVFGGVNLEDISAPRCFEVEAKLKATMNIPIFHDDQHGTAIVALAGLINAAKLVGKKFEDMVIVINGAGASATACAKMILNVGCKDMLILDTKGIIYDGRTEGMNFAKEEMAKITNKSGRKGSLKDVIKGADVFLGVSSPGLLDTEDIRNMAKDAIVFACANPTPEIMPEDALAGGASVVATGRSDFPNQVNNVLAFPGIFRGAFDVRAKDINDEMKLAAAMALASVVTDEELKAEYILPPAFDPRIRETIAKAVAQAARDSGVARI